MDGQKGLELQNNQQESPWVDRFKNTENYSQYSLQLLEATKAFFETQLTEQERSLLEKLGIVILVTGSLLRGNARVGSDIDLMIIVDNKKVTEVAKVVPNLMSILPTERLNKFAISYLNEHAPEQYQKIIDINLADLNVKIKRHLAKIEADPIQFKYYPSHWSNMPVEERRGYVEKTAEMYVEAAQFDVSQDASISLDRIVHDDGVIHGMLSTLFSSDLQTLFGDREVAKKTLLLQLKKLKDEDPAVFEKLFAKIKEGFEKFTTYEGGNHVYGEESTIQAQPVEMPTLEEMMSQLKM